MAEPTSIIAAQIQKLKNELKASEAATERARDIIATQVEVAKITKAKIEALEGILRDLDAPNVDTGSDDEATTSLPKPTEAVVAFLKQRGPHFAHEIATALDGKIRSAAVNQRQLLQNTVFNLQKAGRLVKHGDGRVAAP